MNLRNFEFEEDTFYKYAQGISKIIMKSYR